MDNSMWQIWNSFTVNCMEYVVNVLHKINVTICQSYTYIIFVNSQYGKSGTALLSTVSNDRETLQNIMKIINISNVAEVKHCFSTLSTPKAPRTTTFSHNQHFKQLNFNYNNHTSTAKWKQSWNQSITVNIAERNYAVLGETEKLMKHTKQTTNRQAPCIMQEWKCGVLRHYLHHVLTWIPTDE